MSVDELCRALDRLAACWDRLLYAVTRVRLLTDAGEARFLPVATDALDVAADDVRLGDAIVADVVADVAAQVGAAEPTLAAVVARLPADLLEAVARRRGLLAGLRADVAAEVAASARNASVGVAACHAAQDRVAASGAYPELPAWGGRGERGC